MPKLPKGFGRRRSTANALEEIQNSLPVQPSFRVFERPDGGSKSFDGGMKLAKYSPKPTSSQRHNEDNMFEDLKVNRGSGASNTNTASTTDNSSRLSAASTTPSSTDLPSQEEWRSPHDKPFHDIPIPAVPRTTSAFSLKAAGHTFSFGLTKTSTPSPTTALDEPPPPPLPPKNSNENLKRERAETASSYASTATPFKLEEKELGLNLGGDFADMFSGFGKRKSALLDIQDNGNKSQRMDSSSASPTVPARSYAGNGMNHPSPLNVDHSINVSPSPNSWNSQHSQDRLMKNSSPIQAPPVPHYGSPQVQHVGSLLSSPTNTPQSSVFKDPALTRKPLAPRRQSTTDNGDTADEDTRLLKDSMNSLRRLTESPVDMRARDSWLGPLSKSQSFGALPSASSKKTELAQKTHELTQSDSADLLFDDQIISAADVAQQYQEKAATPPPEQKPKNKVMTPAQFERYRQEQERLKLIGQSKEEDNEADAYDDDEDEAEKQKQVARQRRKQEAHMAVYRQQMMKVTGESSSAAAPPLRSGIQQSRSSVNLLNNGSPSPDEEEEDEEVPLAILAAHGFPNKNRPPSQLPTMSSNPNPRASSMMGAYPAPSQSVAGDPMAGQGGHLPVFARKLPEDPYFGAGLVSPTNRESLALGNGAGSVYGGSSRGAPPGGLVGVIASEERSRAMRRGSPNAAGEYGPPPSNGFNGIGMLPNMQMPPMGRAMTMPNGMGPMGPTGPMMTLGDQAQLEMAHQMQQFMQMQIQFMQMMTSNQGRPQSPLPMPGLPPMGAPPQQGLRPGSSQGRAMSMLDPNAAPWQQAQRNTMYASSIAPSERSNVGLPGRYRPVSHYAGPDNKSRAATMSGAIQDWSDAKQGATTVKDVKKSGDASDEDDEEGWEAMKQKREKKKSIWRSKKDDNASGTMKDLWAFATKSG